MRMLNGNIPKKSGHNGKGNDNNVVSDIIDHFG